MPPGGWITIERRLLDPTYLLAGKYRGLDYKYAWIDMIGMASHRPYNDLGRGQLRASVRFLAERWGWGPRRVLTFLRHLETCQMVKRDIAPTWKHEPSVITICNYQRYQTGDVVEETRTETRPQHGVETRMETRMETKTTNNQKQETRQTSLLPAVANETLVVIRDGVEIRTNGPPTVNVAIPAILGYWIDQQTVLPTQAEIRKQGAAVKRLVNRHGAFETAEAFVGIQHLYAYRDGIYDAFDVERQFTKARQAFHQNEQVIDTDVDWSWLFEKGAT